MRRLLALILFIACVAAPTQAAVTSYQLQSLIISPAGLPFEQRVQFQMVLTAQNVGGESAGTARHAERARFASQVLNNPTQYVASFKQGVIVQLPLASTNMVTVNSVPNADVDTTDAAIQTICANIWNMYIAN